MEILRRREDRPMADRHKVITLASVAVLLAAMTILYSLQSGRTGGAGGIELHIPDLHSRIGAPVRVTITAPGATRVRVLVADSSGMRVVIADAKSPATPNARIATLDLRGLPAGKYRVIAQATDANGSVLAEKASGFRKRTDGSPKVAFDENNAVTRDGQPIFPVGTWMPHFQTGSQGDLIELGEQGRVNTAVVQGLREGGALDGEEFRRFLTACENLDLSGIGLARGGRYELDVPGIVEAAKDSEALLSWMWIDEPEYNEVSPEDARSWTDSAHRVDPHHPVMVNLVGSQFVGQGDEAAARRFTSELIESGKPLPADWISTDYYPVAFANRFGTSLQAAFDNFAEHLAVLSAWTYDLYPTATFIETASQPGIGSNTVPTAEQVWAETWIAVAGGAKAIIWFPHDGESHPDTPGVQRKATTYLTEFAAVLAEPDSQAVSRKHVSGSRVDFVAKEHDGRTYIFAVNRDVEKEALARFTVEGARIESVDVYGESRAIEPTEDGFSDRFRPYDVHIYVITP